MAGLKARVDAYNPTFWLPISLIKSAYLGKSMTTYHKIYSRWEYKFQDGSTVGLDIHPRHTPNVKNKPVVLIVPGIFSESRDHQIVSLSKYIWKSRGWNSIVFNRVGYSKMPITVSHLQCLIV